MSLSKGDILFLIYYGDKPFIYCVPSEEVPYDLEFDRRIYYNFGIEGTDERLNYHKYFGYLFIGNESDDDYEKLTKDQKKLYKELMDSKPIFEKYEIIKSIHSDNIIETYSIHFIE